MCYQECSFLLIVNMTPLTRCELCNDLLKLYNTNNCEDVDL